jgi:Uracil DNA glycosylase superfamily
MRWAPAQGHVPRGFSGATGALEEVQLVLVAAEPGDPHPGEQHLAQGNPPERLASAYRYASECLRSKKDLFHRNLRHFLALCWPDDTFDQQLRKTWLTDAVLCSATREGASVPAAVERECRRQYLEAQLALFPRAVIVALGKKAQHRLKRIPDVVPAWSVAPPGCNRSRAKESWADAAREVRTRVRQP